MTGLSNTIQPRTAATARSRSRSARSRLPWRSRNTPRPKAPPSTISACSPRARADRWSRSSLTICNTPQRHRRDQHLLRLRRLRVDAAFGDARELLVSRAFFIKRALKRVRDILQPQPLREIPDRAVAGNLVCRLLLGSSDQAGVERVGVAGRFEDRLAFRDQSLHRVARHALGVAVEPLKDVFQ